MAARQYLLICEGACNPGISQVDGDLRRLARVERSVSAMRMQLGDSELWLHQKALRHTPHKMVGDQEAKCLTCGATRQYGGSRKPYAPVEYGHVTPAGTTTTQ